MAGPSGTTGGARDAVPVTMALELPELVGTRLAPLAVAGLPAGSPMDVAGDGRVEVTVSARTGFVLAAAG